MGSPDILADSTLRWHEWQIAIALRDITDLRAEYEYNAAASTGPLTSSVLGPQQRALQLAQDAIESRIAATLSGPAGRTGHENASWRS